MELMNKEKALLSVEEVSKYLGIGLSTAYALFKEDGFPYVKIRSRKYANKELLDNWIKEKANS